MLKLASDGIIGFSTKPIKVIGGFGITFVIVSIVILLYFILSKIFGITGIEIAQLVADIMVFIITVPCTIRFLKKLKKDSE